MPAERVKVDISIHAPREGGDVERAIGGRLVFVHFNPRPPRGGRRLHSGLPLLG